MPTTEDDGFGQSVWFSQMGYFSLSAHLCLSAHTELKEHEFKWLGSNFEFFHMQEENCEKKSESCTHQLHFTVSVKVIRWFSEWRLRDKEKLPWGQH